MSESVQKLDSTPNDHAYRTVKLGIIREPGMGRTFFTDLVDDSPSEHQQIAQHLAQHLA